MSEAVAGTHAAPTASGLSAFEADLLEFEAVSYKAPEGKDAAILQRFGLSVTRYHQELNALIDRPEALAHHPLLVKRLRRQRSTRQQKRSARHLPFASTV
ncbi:MAG: DUF3263 domain-containing protein [Propionibacteriaceae bacterium]|nr:DUF3263 domain-containing protein [Propionibacteriaceae bacterium]